MRWEMVGAVLMTACALTAGCRHDEACNCAAAAGESLAPAVFKLADERVAQPAKVVRGIDEALSVCEYNLAHVGEKGFRATHASVGGDGKLRVQLDDTQGNLEDTKRDLDVGIQGRGYFKVKVRDDAGDTFAYTRCGNFFTNADGTLILVTPDGGHALEPEINLPPNVVETRITETGSVEYETAGSADYTAAGQLRLWRFPNPERLVRIAEGLYRESESSGTPLEDRPGEDGAGITLQGFLEASNVNVERERMRMNVLRNWREAVVESAR